MHFLLCLISTGLQNHNTSSVGFPWPKMCAAKTNRYRHLPRLVVSVTGVTCIGRGSTAAWVQGFGGSPCLSFCWMVAAALTSVLLALTAA